nr:hypothetical protein CFP56_35789 [Quercus suber]
MRKNTSHFDRLLAAHFYSVVCCCPLPQSLMFINAMTKVLLNEKLYVSYVSMAIALAHGGISQKSLTRQQNSSFGSRDSISYTLLDATVSILKSNWQSRI